VDLRRDVNNFLDWGILDRERKVLTMIDDLVKKNKKTARKAKAKSKEKAKARAGTKEAAGDSKPPSTAKVLRRSERDEE